MTDQYAGRWSRPGPGLVAIENWKSVPHKRMLLDGKLPRRRHPTWWRDYEEME